MSLKPAPRLRQFNKLYGLKKLREIARHTPGIATYARFKVYADHRQLRLSHARGKPRLLIRGDEKGKEYRTTNWDTIPRSEISAAMREEEIKNHLIGIEKKRLIVKKHGEKPEDESFLRRARFIVHPTRLISDVGFAGELRLIHFGNKPAVLLKVEYWGKGFFFKVGNDSFFVGKRATSFIKYRLK